MTRIPELRSEIRQKNEEIANLAHRIEDRIGVVTNWRGMVYRHPLISVAVGVGVGLLAAGMMRPVLRVAARQGLLVARSALLSAAVGSVTARVTHAAMEEHGSATNPP